MAKNHYPVVRHAQLEISTGLPGTQVGKLVQIDRELSKLNRRLYRQGRYYRAKIDLHPDATGNYLVFALRDDWAVQKAYQMAYAQYQKNTADERASLGNKQLARWEDFRVQVGGFNFDTLVSTLFDGTATVPLTSGTFDLAHVVDANDVRRSFTWSNTPTAGQYGLLVEYDKAGNAQITPQSSANLAPYVDIDSEVNDQTAADLQLDNREPPYDQGGVNANGEFVCVGVLGNAAGSQRLSTGFFTAPCGFVLIVAPTAADQGTDLLFEVQGGDYKGVNAPSMLE